MTRLNSVTTHRLLLRTPLDEDLAALYAIHHDPRTNDYNPSGPMRSLEEAHQTLLDWQAHWRQHGFGYWAACLQESPGAAIGFGGLRWRELQGEPRLNLYFRFDPAAWGHGYASELGRAALAVAWDKLGHTAVYATTRPNNLPSIRTLERLGLAFGKELKDEYGISLLYVIEKS